jgi:hypothetical protein
MASGIKSIHDPDVQNILKAANLTFHPSPEAWEDQFM